MSGSGRSGGFTLVELLVGLVVTGLVATSAYKLLLGHQRMHQQQMARAELQGNMRAAAAILASELRDVARWDSLDSDFVAIADSSVSYKAARNLFYVCQPPIDLGASGTMILSRASSLFRQLDHARDSLFVFAEADTATRADDIWVHVNLAAPTVAGNGCPGGTASLTVIVNNVTPNGGLGSVKVSAPVRGFEVVQLTTYRDTYGDWWMGMRQFAKASGWGRIQPVVGPLMPGGLRFAFYDMAGTRTSDARLVSLIGVTLIGRSHRPVRVVNGSIAYVADTLTTAIALRNSAW